MTLLELPRPTDPTLVRKPGAEPITRASLLALVDTLGVGNSLVVMPVTDEYYAPGTLLVVDIQNESLTDTAFTVCDAINDATGERKSAPVLIVSTHLEDMPREAAEVVIAGVTSIFEACKITVGDYVIMTPDRVWCDPTAFTYEGKLP
jgi:hypothetical protein